MAEHECRYVGFSGGQRRCPVCLSYEPEATTAGGDHGDDQQEDQRDETSNEDEVRHEVDPAQYESTDEPGTDVVVDEDKRDDDTEEPKPRRRRSGLFQPSDD